MNVRILILFALCLPWSVHGENDWAVAPMAPFLYPGIGPPWADDDGDGLTNFQEYVAGTHPGDPLSRWSSMLRTDETGNLLLEWPSIAGKIYRVESSTDLQNWQIEMGDMLGTGDVISVVVAESLLPEALEMMSSEQEEGVETADLHALAEWERRRQKDHIILGLAGIAYGDLYTELTWWHQGQTYRAVTGIDLRLIQNIAHFETDHAIYHFFLFPIFLEKRDMEEKNQLSVLHGYPPPYPTGTPSALREMRPNEDFLLVDGPLDFSPEALQAIQDLHTYVRENEKELEILRQEREQRQLERAVEEEEMLFLCGSPQDPQRKFWR